MAAKLKPDPLDGGEEGNQTSCHSSLTIAPLAATLPLAGSWWAS